MTSDFDLLMTDGNTALGHVHGEDLVYTPDGGDAVPLTVPVTRHGQREAETEHGTRIVLTVSASLPTASAPDAAKGDTLTLDSADWYVYETDGPVGASVTVRAVRYASGQESPEDFKPPLPGI